MSDTSSPEAEDDLPDEYDVTAEQLRNGIMGKYVGRFTEQIRGFATVLRERQKQQEQTRHDEAA